MAPQCTALNISDKSKCQESATSLNGLFCTFHSKQCQGMYLGYKRRNARLNALVASPPSYLAKSKVPLVNNEFSDVETLEGLRELYDHFSKRYRLLDCVILARKLHHEHFFSMNCDYGHASYLGKLNRDKLTALRALERLERRTADVLYNQQKWFKWVRDTQDEEEKHREIESKKAKREAALLRRHRKEFERRMRELKAKEDRNRQEHYLEEAYRERMAQGMSQEEEEEMWDPVEDVVGVERGSYIDLIKHFLMMKDESPESLLDKETPEDSSTMVQDHGPTDMHQTEGSKPPKKKSKKEAGNKTAESAEGGSKPQSVDISTIETESQMRKRLKEGVKYNHASGLHIYGTIENPFELKQKTFPLPDDEIDRLIGEIAEIKKLLFCRLLLAHASVLPAALRANSVEEFLNDKEVTNADLRDLCMKMEKPALQEVRDACADLFRGDEEGDDNEPDGTDDKDEAASDDEKDERGVWARAERRAQPVPRVWRTRRERELQRRRQRNQAFVDQSLGESGNTLVDFGHIEDESNLKSKKMRIKVCGKYIYNYPSERAMSRGGWLQFCIIAKDSQLYDAIELCRHWDEFMELNILALFQYFPSANWVQWGGDRLRHQYLLLGFFPYFQCDTADQLTFHHQSGSRGRGPRAHAHREFRNFICAHIKRNDPASRRFIQYMCMQTSRLNILVRDAKTGKTLVTPRKEELWLIREKTGLGRASKHEWRVLSKVGTKFFEEMEKHRRWHFGFDDYYSVYVWDVEPGDSFQNLYNNVQQVLIKARRYRSVVDFYNLAAPVLKTIVREPKTGRARDIKPGESSIWDDMTSAQSRFMTWDSDMKEVEGGPDKREFYNEADMAEDAVLFPDEVTGDTSMVLFKETKSVMTHFEKIGPDISRWVYDLDTDEELSDVEMRDDDDESDDLCSSCAGSTNGHHQTHRAGSEEDEEDEGFDMDHFRKDFVKAMTLSSKETELSKLAKFMRPLPASTPEDMHEEFMEFIDREKSKVFKESWHKADLEPGAPQRYTEALNMIKQIRSWQANHDAEVLSVERAGPPLKMILAGHGGFTHRRVWRDYFHAYAAIALFYTPEFFESELGSEFKDSLLVNQAERAKHLPNRRRHESAKCMPKEFWKEWDDIHKKAHKDKIYIDQAYPFEWDVATRPIIAHFYKEGLIQPSYAPYPGGKAIAHAEPGRPLDLYIDFRIALEDMTMKNDLQDPRTITVATIRNHVRSFASANPQARFSLIRIWSAPHFYPLMIGYDKREGVAFADGVGRVWEWKFIPKDMPCSEWSMHHQARLRIKPWEKMLKDKVVVKRDLYLVMGKDEEECRTLSTIVAYAVGTNPWRLEVDWWRSFVGVDKDFLEGLDDKWID